jgi:tartrate dehydrogenase/decarboxylase/D-malate dehydrogenase
MNQIGLVIGGGTGRELGEVFRAAADAFAALGERPVAVKECPSELGSFTELHGLPAAECARIVQRDLVDLGRFYREFYRAGGRAIFRTAVNAETLYALRRQLQAVKVSHVALGRCRVSFIRDQHQGFYTCDAWDHADGAIRFQGSFRKAGLQRIHDYALAESSAWLGPDHDTWFVYKHHLFGNSFVSWASEINPRATVLQPGMAYAKLASRIESGGQPLLLIAGNEIGDLLQEVFLAGTGLEHRETTYSRNVYLHPDTDGLVEYQTVHGSADDIGGQQRVNPVATLRAAAALFEEHLELPGIVAAMEEAVAEAFACGLLRQPAGITRPTGETAAKIVESAVRMHGQGALEQATVR